MFINWLTILPIEWGFVGPKLKVNLVPDIRVAGPADRLGWYASKGAAAYGQLINTNQPNKLVVYGGQVANVIGQGMRLAAVNIPVFSIQVSGWQGMASATPVEVEWDLPVVQPAADHPWVAALFGYEPCTFRSFDYATMSVWAPCLVGPQLPAMGRQALRGFAGQELDNVGIQMQLSLQMS